MSVRNARGLAEKLAEERGFSVPPVDVRRIAQDHGLPVLFEALGEGISGVLVTHGGSSYIGVTKADAHCRQRFTIAHELGHYFLRHRFEEGSVHVDHGHSVSYRADRKAPSFDIREYEANQFAACLLMPSKMIRGAIARLSPTSGLWDFHVVQLATQFDVSEQAMTIRLSTLGLM
jgi:Zn-dependent peptidase ImmA (M78 family)